LINSLTPITPGAQVKIIIPGKLFKEICYIFSSEGNQGVQKLIQCINNYWLFSV
jgi:hypothetical protein